MNGAQALIRTLVDSGVDVCFGNPGTSEMHFVAALDSVPEMRGVLTLFEGGATGAADGYARMTGRPAAVLLHLGPGLGNGLANLHNARRAFTPVVTVVGDHATYHAKYDAPLQSDIAAIAGAVSGWVRSCGATTDVGTDAADAVTAALTAPGGVATLILPADTSWSEGGKSAVAAAPAAPAQVTDDAVAAAAAALTGGEKALILIGGRSATAEAGLRAVARVRAATGATVLTETFPARLQRGAGLPPVGRLGYLSEQVDHQLTGVRHIVLAGARSPVSFFAYPGRSSDQVPDGCQVHTLATGAEDVVAALEALADRVGAAADLDPALLAAPSRPDLPAGELNAWTAAQVVGALLPAGAIVVDEANTSGLGLPDATAGAPRHDLLTLTGGAIGQGIPVATGAAIACPDRPVLCLEADGSAMYTLQALWTQAREGLDVTTVIFDNSAYAILRMELQRVGAEGGPKARSLLDLSSPNLDFVSLARGLGVPAERATTAEELADALRRAFAEPGPHLVDAVVPPLL